MNRTLSLLLLLIVCQLFGQDNLLQITYLYNDGTRQEVGDLYYKSDSTIFVLNDFKKKNTQENVEFDKSKNRITINQPEIDIAKRVFYHRLGENVYYQSIPVNGLLIKDEMPKIQWHILSDEIKEIGSYTATKAVADFRGSKIECYFTYDIPISSGPWKFDGLPGLILEVYTSDYQTRWEVSKIEVFNNDEEFMINFNLPKGNFITQKEFIKQDETEASQILRQIQSRAPEGVHAQKVQMKRLGFEKIFEWEED